VAQEMSAAQVTAVMRNPDAERELAVSRKQAVAQEQAVRVVRQMAPEPSLQRRRPRVSNWVHHSC